MTCVPRIDGGFAWRAVVYPKAVLGADIQVDMVGIRVVAHADFVGMGQEVMDEFLVGDAV